MYGVIRPFIGRDGFDLFVNALLQRDKDGVELFGNGSDYLNVIAQGLKDGVTEIIAEHRRLTYHKPAVTFFFCFAKQQSAGRFEFIGIDSL